MVRLGNPLALNGGTDMPTQKREQRLGPIQFVAIGLHKDNLKGQIAKALRVASKSGAIRVLDALAIQKSKDGTIKSLGGTDLTPKQRKEYGALVGALMGLGATGTVEGAQEGAELGEKAFARKNFGLSKADIKAVAADIPVDRTILLVLFEHRWAVDLKKALLSADGEMLAQGFIQPETLVEVGAELSDAWTAAQEYEHVTA
jgi:uncharacterized membrane protein